MDQQQQSRWRNRVLWIGGILATLAVIAILFAGRYRHGLTWTGFTDRTLWDWLKLLGAIAVPVLIAYFGQRISSLQYRGQREAEEQRAQDEALQAYLD